MLILNYLFYKNCIFKFLSNFHHYNYFWTFFFSLKISNKALFLPLIWTDPKNLGGTIDLLSSVRPYFRPSVRPSVRPDGFRSNGSIVFSDFWHQGSFLWFQKTDEAGFLKKKIFWPKMAKKVWKICIFEHFLATTP